MTDKHLSDEQYGRMSRHMTELLRKADEGLVEFEWTMSSLLMLVNGRRLVLPKEIQKVPKAKGPAKDVVSVPDLSSAELFQLAKAKIGVTDYDERLEYWDFYAPWGDEANQAAVRSEIVGRKYDVLTWHPKPVDERVGRGRDRKYKTSDEVRELFEELGADGIFPVFLTWLMSMERIPEGRYACIPSDPRLSFHADGSGKVPCFLCDSDGSREFFFKDRRDEDVWSFDDDWTLVAFRGLFS